VLGPSYEENAFISDPPRSHASKTLPLCGNLLPITFQARPSRLEPQIWRKRHLLYKVDTALGDILLKLISLDYGYFSCAAYDRYKFIGRRFLNTSVYGPVHNSRDNRSITGFCLREILMLERSPTCWAVARCSHGPEFPNPFSNGSDCNYAWLS